LDYCKRIKGFRSHAGATRGKENQKSKCKAHNYTSKFKNKGDGIQEPDWDWMGNRVNPVRLLWLRPSIMLRLRSAQALGINHPENKFSGPSNNGSASRCDCG
jgi:hypothetical protein